MGTLRWIVLVSLLCAVPLMAQHAAPLRPPLIEAHAVIVSEHSVFDLQQSESAVEKKKVGLAAIYSLILPGMGELYAKGFSSGRYFLVAEGVCWLTYFSFDIYGNSLRDDARTYAVAHAGVNPAGKSDQFYVDVGNFLTTADYNDKKLRDRDPSLVYNASVGYAWRWDSDVDRLAFRDQRVSSENWYNNKKFVAAAILINHVASAINAARAAIAYNKGVDDALGDLRFGASVMGGFGNPHGVMLTIEKGF